MPSPSEVFERDLTEARGIYHVWQARFPGYEGEWILFKQGNDRATKIGSKSEVARKANELLDAKFEGALMVVRWKTVSTGSHDLQRIREIYVAEPYGTRRIEAGERKMRL